MKTNDNLIVAGILLLGILPMTVLAEEKLVDKAKEFTEFYANRLTKDKMTEQASQLEHQFHLDQLQIDEETAKMLRALRNPFIPQLPDELPKEDPEIPEGEPTDAPQDNPEAIPTGEATGNAQGIPVVEEVVLPKPDYKISGIVWNTDRPQAIIEGRVMDIGDSIEQWRIIGISRGGVEILFRNQKFLIEP